MSTRASYRGIRRPDARMRRRTLGLLVIAVATIVLLVVPAYAGWRLFIVADAPGIESGLSAHVEIPEGAGTAEIAITLAEAGVVRNSAFFRVRARLDGVDGSLRPGVYDLETGMGYGEVIDLLLAGPPLAYSTVTVPEGFTVEQIAARLEEEAGIPAAEFTALALGGADVFVPEHPYLAGVYSGSLEGYLFPKTYQVLESADATAVIEAMLDQFDAEVATLDLTFPASCGLSLHQTVTLASMIEREARIPDERPLVSSVIYNRLERDMLLEIDATIEYIIKRNRPRLLLSDLRIQSPYNTYLNRGLPPGPIASPGLASLQAAVAPADTEYLYYVLTGEDGSHTFTETLEEFLIAKEKSREVTP